VVAIVDQNGRGQSHPNPWDHDSSVFAERFRSFGWNAVEIDGHDLAQVVNALAQTLEDGPTAIIARTLKGKGVSFVEDEPGWHGKALDEEQAERALRELGEPGEIPTVEPRRLGRPAPAPRTARVEASPQYDPDDEAATRDGYGKALRTIGEAAWDIVALDGDVMGSTRAKFFQKEHPERFFEGYIAEQSIAGAGMGLAACGKTPFVASFACFLSRAADFVRMAGHSRLPHLVFCGSHAGVSIGEDGPSQMGLEDIAAFRAIGGSTVLYPSDAVSAERLTAEAANTPGLVYLRTTRPKTKILYANEEPFPVGGSKILRVSQDDRATIVAAGITVHEALAAHDALEKAGVRTRVIDAYSVKPLDVATLVQAAQDTGALVVVEDHWAAGGLGDAVAGALAGAVKGGVRLRRLAVVDEPRSGPKDALLELCGISRRHIEAAVNELVAVAA
jgi:transketolase